MSRMVGGVNMSSNSNTKSSDKRKERGPSKDQLLESMSTKSDFSSLHMDQQGCNIPEIVVELHLILGVSIDDDFYEFATEYLSLKRKPEMWFSMGVLEEKLKWLK
ncbi:hypothetical protein POTOM_035422 [Populus tomentosa]|uniref:Uncharacterized protein n=1 Tax=Populus tomentosa TaxID=118781 RepID=A0A8X8CM11_POPTO|nr:hypothetical protein POTOM_035422 [Populus tomentosa]